MLQIHALWDSSAKSLGDDDLAERLLQLRNWAVRQLTLAADLVRAIDIGLKTLTDCERVLGPDHPDTLTSRNNLAYAYESAGDLGRAIPLYEQTLADRERVLGPDHPDTLTSRNNLAYAYETAGGPGTRRSRCTSRPSPTGAGAGPRPPGHADLAEQPRLRLRVGGRPGRAIPLYEQTLADRERVLGADHPDTLTSRNNLAAAYESAGDWTRRSPCTSRPWPTGSGCWAPTTPTP